MTTPKRGDRVVALDDIVGYEYIRKGTLGTVDKVGEYLTYVDFDEPADYSGGHLRGVLVYSDEIEIAVDEIEIAVEQPSQVLKALDILTKIEKTVRNDSTLDVDWLEHNLKQLRRALLLEIQPTQ